MRILLSDTWGSGGASTFVGTLARGLVSRGHDVDVVVGYTAGPSVSEYAGDVRAVFHPPTDFAALAVSGRYDILHGTEDDVRSPFNYQTRVQRLGLATKVVVTCHQENALVEPGSADAVVVLSAAAHGAADPRHADLRLIPNGVDAARIRRAARTPDLVDEPGPLAVWVGRVEDPYAHKDFLGLVSVMRDLTGAGWSIAVVDGSTPSVHYPAEVQLYRWFGGHVKYFNHLPHMQVAGLLAHAGARGGAFISTSRIEAAPMIALEALAVGCPVVTPLISGYEALRELRAVTTYQSPEDLIAVLTNQRHLSVHYELPPSLDASTMVRSYEDLYAEIRGEATMAFRKAPARTAVRLRSQLRRRFLTPSDKAL